jgi:hypothetical protein
MQLSQGRFAKYACLGITETTHGSGVFERGEENKRLARLQAEFESTSFAGTIDEGAPGDTYYYVIIVLMKMTQHCKFLVFSNLHSPLKYLLLTSGTSGYQNL